VLSTEWITGSPVDYVTVVLVLVSSHCNCYYNWMDKLSMVNWNELLNQIHSRCPCVY
jgi:hypothetical protein